MTRKHLERLASRQIEETLNDLWLAASEACEGSHNNDQTRFQRIPRELINFMRLVSIVQSRYGVFIRMKADRGSFGIIPGEDPSEARK